VTDSIPFALSNSSDDAHGERHLVVSAPRRRASGQIVLSDDGLHIHLDAPDARRVLVPYGDIGSVVFTHGIIRNRLRLTAREPEGFARVGARRPNELTALIGRRHRDGAREFVAELRQRIARAHERRRQG
jgi:hypothetical protein